MTTHEDKAKNAARDLMLQLLLALDLNELLQREGMALTMPRLHLVASITEELGRYVREEIENDRL